ncbi:SpaA isopeptide-forming pilin-related protein [Microbacterium sp.]|uniref:DUF6923 family protein n=1 Tax=Microbacterium sp. TaxID=51671 RepID=UPI0026307ED9|nr:SpaA isopeptide-forming pilin-related protein [Microbacterium sp.]
MAKPRSSNRGKRLLAMLAGVAVLVGGMLVGGGAPSAQAAAGDPFDPSTPTVFISQGTPTQLQRAETRGDGSFTFVNEGGRASSGYNAIGFNPADNYIYGIVSETGGNFPQGSLVRIGQGGVVTRVGTTIYSDPVSGSRQFFSGAFNPADGLFYIGSTNSANVLALNVATGAVAKTIALRDPIASNNNQLFVPDFAFKDGYAWGSASNGSIRRIDMNTGNITRFTGVLPDSAAGYGAVWTFGNGNLGLSANSTGLVYQVVISNPASANPTFEVADPVTGPSSTLNDGTSIPGLPADLSITKTGPAEFVSGSRIEYELTVTNNGSGSSSGWTVIDTLPAGMSDPTISAGVTATVTGDRISVAGGRLAVGASTTFRIAVNTNVPVGECRTNVATVEGNEADSNAANDSGSAQACSVTREWSLAKAAFLDGQPLADGATVQPGDTLSYRVTAANTGTAAVPDVVLTDDLAGVLDDATFTAGSGSLVVAGGTPQPVADPSGDSLTAGPVVLPPGASAVLSYDVVVGADSWSRELRNTVSGTGLYPPAACDENCSTLQVTPSLVQVQKVGESATGQVVPMDGSLWAVYAAAQGGTPVRAPLPPRTDDSGQPAIGLFVTSLEAGSYYLEETRALPGFQLLAQRVGFTVDAAGTIVLTDAAATLSVVDVDGVATIRVEDVPRYVLPATGGPGEGAVYLAGSILILLAFGALHRARVKHDPTS